MTDTWIWNRYWQFDRIASCFDGAGASNYSEAVASGWRNFFHSLPPHSRILDLCTGNGAIAILSAQVSALGSKDFRITGVDAADIDPRRFVTRHQKELQAIEFQSGIEIEQLPFEPASFDAVVSQYGIEYADLSRAIIEAARVLSPGGTLRFVMHAAEGTVAANARRVMAEVSFLLEEIDLGGAAIRCFEAVTGVERGSKHSAEGMQVAQHNLAVFEEALRQVGERIPTAADPLMLRNSAATLIDLHKRRGQYELDQLRRAAENVESEWLAHRGRLAELLRAAVTVEQRESLVGMVRELGAKQVDHFELVAEKSLIGHVVEARF